MGKVYKRKHNKRKRGRKKLNKHQKELNRWEQGWIFELDGTKYYSTTPVCEKIGVARAYFKAFKSKGIIPEPIYYRYDMPPKKGQPVGYYSESQVRLLKKAFKLSGKNRLSRVSEYLHKNWERNEQNQKNTLPRDYS